MARFNLFDFPDNTPLTQSKSYRRKHAKPRESQRVPFKSSTTTWKPTELTAHHNWSQCSSCLPLEFFFFQLRFQFRGLADVDAPCQDIRSFQTKCMRTKTRFPLSFGQCIFPLVDTRGAGTAYGESFGCAKACAYGQGSDWDDFYTVSAGEIIVLSTSWKHGCRESGHS